MVELPIKVGRVGEFACSTQCYGNCEHCKKMCQKIGVFEDLEHFRRRGRW